MLVDRLRHHGLLLQYSDGLLFVYSDCFVILAASGTISVPLEKNVSQESKNSARVIVRISIFSGELNLKGSTTIYIDKYKITLTKSRNFRDLDSFYIISNKIREYSATLGLMHREGTPKPAYQTLVEETAKFPSLR